MSLGGSADPEEHGWPMEGVEMVRPGSFPTDDCAYIAFIFQSCPASVAPSSTEHRLPYVSHLIQFH